MKTQMVNREFLERTCRVERDRPDPRDFSVLDVCAVREIATEELPRSFQIPDSELPQVGDQLTTGSCVGWAAAWGLRHWLCKKETGQEENFSVRFVWMAAKEIDPFPLNIIFPLSGTRIRDAMKIMQQHGVPEESLYPFSVELPPPGKRIEIIQNAMKYRIGLYYSLSNVDEMRWNLANVGPFVIGVPVHENFSELVDNVIPEPSGRLVGGHALLVVGYDDDTSTFRVMNSWSLEWGDQGFCKFTYDWVRAHYWNAWAVLPGS